MENTAMRHYSKLRRCFFRASGNVAVLLGVWLVTGCAENDGATKRDEQYFRTALPPITDSEYKKYWSKRFPGSENSVNTTASREIPTEPRSLDFKGPQEIVINRTYAYSAVVHSRAETAQETDDTKIIRVSGSMQAELLSDSDAVHIQPLHSDEVQPIEPDESTEWRWNVRVDREGIYQLTLTMHLIDDRSSKTSKKLYKSEKRTVVVTATRVEALAHAFQKYYAAAAALVSALVVWLGFGETIRKFIMERSKAKKEAIDEKARKMAERKKQDEQLERDKERIL